MDESASNYFKTVAVNALNILASNDVGVGTAAIIYRMLEPILNWRSVKCSCLKPLFLN